jgi:hypothetical protein
MKGPGPLLDALDMRGKVIIIGILEMGGLTHPPEIANVGV